MFRRLTRRSTDAHNADSESLFRAHFHMSEAELGSSAQLPLVIATIYLYRMIFQPSRAERLLEKINPPPYSLHRRRIRNQIGEHFFTSSQERRKKEIESAPSLFRESDDHYMGF